MFCSRFSTRPRSRDKTELESSGLAADEPAEERHPGYSGELEALCAELQATLEGLVRGRPSPGQGPLPRLRLLVGLCSACPTNLVSEMRPDLPSCMSQGLPVPTGSGLGLGPPASPEAGQRRVGVTAFQQSSIYRH